MQNWKCAELVDEDVKQIENDIDDIKSGVYQAELDKWGALLVKTLCIRVYQTNSQFGTSLCITLHIVGDPCQICRSIKNTHLQQNWTGNTYKVY